MKCQNAEKLILLKDEGTLSGKLAEGLAAHLAGCPPCRSFQDTLLESKQLFPALDEPSATVVQNVLREARLNAPAKKQAPVFGWRPALAMAASVAIVLGIFFAAFTPDRVGMELVVTENQLLDYEDSLVNVMYSGLSEDDLAFNFLMTYEGNGQG